MSSREIDRPGASEADDASETDNTRVSTGLIRAGMGGAVLLLAVIGFLGLIRGFGNGEVVQTPQAVLPEEAQAGPLVVDTTDISTLTSNWSIARKRLDEALAESRQQTTTNSKALSQINAQKKASNSAEEQLNKSIKKVAGAKLASKDARDNLDTLESNTLSRRLLAAKVELDETIEAAERAHRVLQSAKAEQTRIIVTVDHLKNAANAAEASATAADVVVAAAKSAQLAVAENQDVVSASDEPTMARLESDFFNEATQQAEAALKSARAARKAVLATEQRLEFLAAKLAEKQSDFVKANKAEELAHINYAAIEKKSKDHLVKKAAAQDSTSSMSKALAIAEKRVAENQILLLRESEQLKSLILELEAGRKANREIGARVASLQEVFGKAEIELRSAQRIKSQETAATLAALNADLHDRLRKSSNIAGVRQTVHDRFVLSSEALFDPGSATLGKTGKQIISNITGIIEEVTGKVPEHIDWVLRVDGHSDSSPISGQGNFKDNWELSQARALSVVKHLIERSDMPPQNLSANGFGEYRPLNTDTDQRSQASNRRIEFVLSMR